MIKETLLSLALQCAPGIHPDTVHDIARTESGLNPYAVAEIITAKNIKSHFPDSFDEAQQLIKRLNNSNARYSVGLMQIYSGNLKKFDVTAEDMLNPCKNLVIAEKILTDCYKRGGSLKNALSCYYSGNFETGYKKETAFNNTSYIERIGGVPIEKRNTTIIVPSTKTVNQVSTKQVNKTTVTKISDVIYPDYIIRGQVITHIPKGE